MFKQLQGLFSNFRFFKLLSKYCSSECLQTLSLAAYDEECMQQMLLGLPILFSHVLINRTEGRPRNQTNLDKIKDNLVLEKSDV